MLIIRGERRRRRSPVQELWGTNHEKLFFSNWRIKSRQMSICLHPPRQSKCPSVHPYQLSICLFNYPSKSNYNCPSKSFSGQSKSLSFFKSLSSLFFLGIFFVSHKRATKLLTFFASLILTQSSSKVEKLKRNKKSNFSFLCEKKCV